MTPFTDYGNEGSVGTAIRESGLARSELYITTKYARDPIQQSVRSSLESVSFSVARLLETDR